MDRLFERTAPGKLAVFKMPPAKYGPSEDDACPWVWECYADARLHDGWHAGGTGTTWEQAWARGRTHAEREHGARF